MITSPPLSTEPLKVELAAPTVASLRDGTDVYVVHRPTEDLVTVQVYIDTGPAHDTVRGASAFAAELMMHGAGDRDAEAFDIAVESLGCAIRTSVLRSETTVSALGMAENFEPMMALFGDVVLRPRFDASEVEVLRRRWLSELSIDLRDLDWLASMASHHVRYGNHPYRHAVRGLQADMEAMTRDAVTAAHDRFLRSKRTLFVAGPLTADVVVDVLDRVLEGLPPVTFHDDLAMSSVSVGTACIAASSSSSQSALRLCLPGASYAHPDYAALLLITQVLGASSLSRLFTTLREEKGYTYGAYADLTVRPHSATIDLLTNVGKEFTADTMDIIAREVDRLSSEPISAEELEHASQTFIGHLVRTNETPQRSVSLLRTIAREGLPTDFFTRLVDRLQALTAEELLPTQRAFFSSQRWAIGAAGDPAVLEPVLRSHAATIDLWDPVGGDR